MARILDIVREQLSCRTKHNITTTGGHFKDTPRQIVQPGPVGVRLEEAA